MKRTNCPNCGYPIQGYKCEYCGTHFYDFTNMEMGKASYFRIKDSSFGVMELRAVPTLASLSMATDEAPTFELELCVLTVKAIKGE